MTLDLALRMNDSILDKVVSHFFLYFGHVKLFAVIGKTV